MSSFYFDRFENRTPPAPLEYSVHRELLWQFLATLALVFGGWYIAWRWTSSLNVEALWFSLPLVIAETGAFIGLILFVFNLWRDDDIRIDPPPALMSECEENPDGNERPISIDVFFATYSEDPELVRLGIRDAKCITYPHPIRVNIHVLDDGRRPHMRSVAREEGVGYITRENNTGYKAGNLRNALERTSGDFIMICDADTRPFPTLLQRTMGYFRDPKVAWVQTPQWFFDLPEGVPLPTWLGRIFGRCGSAMGGALQAIIGHVQIGRDPFVNDPQMFYDIILRRRNWANAAFCCGAGSIHRREAVMEAALRSYGRDIDKAVAATVGTWKKKSREHDVASTLLAAIRSEEVSSRELTPYKFHVSEDIYTSIVLHSDRERGWKSIQHPYVESKMLSPQDMLSWTTQRFKYAGGTLDIAINENPLFRTGLTIKQKLMYATTIWSYFGCIWNLVFLVAPAIYLFTNISPVSAYSGDFFVRIFAFLITLELATMVGTWGIAGYQSKASYIAFFPVNLRALWTVLRGQKISFPITPKDRQAGRHLRLVWPQCAVILVTVIGAAYGWACYLSGFQQHALAGLVANTFWGVNNILALSGIVGAVFWEPDTPEAMDKAHS